MVSKKVGIVTFHRSYNYGSVLQAYALQEFIKRCGYQVSIIDYCHLDNFEQYKIFRTNSYKAKPQLFPVDIFCFRENLKRKNSFDTFLAKYLQLTAKKYNEYTDMRELNRQFDTFVCGSDQIWNLDCTRGIVPAFYLEFVEKENKKVAYGPSLATSSFQKKYFDAARITADLNSFFAISLREKSTVPFYQAYTQKPITSVLDPVLLWERNEYDDMAIKPKEAQPYIFLYMLEKYDKRLVEYCNALYESMGIKTIYMSKWYDYSIKKGKKVFGCRPEEFLGYVKNAQYVITNSFHATAFSILFQKQFCTFTTRKSFARMQDLLGELGLTQRIYHSNMNIEDAICYDEVFTKLRQLRAASQVFLLSALEG